MKIALAQMKVIPGALEQNLCTMIEMIETAKKQSVDLIAFPEMCLSGYLLSDQWLDRSYCREIMRYHERVREASDGIAIAFGSIYEDLDIQARLNSNAPHPNKDGRSRLYNAVLVVQNGQYVPRAKSAGILPEGVQPKTLLPNYRFFDDQRYFFSLLDISLDHGVPIQALASPFLIDINGESVPVGFEVCEDLWCQDYRLNGAALNITRHLVSNGAQAIVNISASTWTYLKHDARDRRVRFLADDLGNDFVPFYYVNNVGAQNNGKNIITFDGGTTVYNRRGEPCIISDAFFEPDLLIADHSNLPTTPCVRHESGKVEQKFHAIVSGLRYLKDMLGWQNHPSFVVGLSGGIDSALVVSLLVAGLGAERVAAVNMPTRFNSQATQDVAKHVAQALNIDYLAVPIQSLVEAHQSVFSTLDQHYLGGDGMRALSDENIQAKIRGTSILSNIAGRYGRMFTNNGNKLEIALGYATLYGDVGGVIAPIGDLTKTEVYELARFINDRVFEREVIPLNLFPDELFRFEGEAIAPSAELREAQIDPMKFGYHCALVEAFTRFSKVNAETVLQWYLEGTMEQNLHIPSALLQRWGLEDPKLFVDDLEWFADCISKQVFKRIQAPPIVVTSPSAYGYDIRESQLPIHRTARYLELKQAVLALTAYRPSIPAQA